ncbi:hypothetical protein GSI_01783 [Ganoderma sinense ZZ0214-1]|uniref:Uncharacterized protein n=1 Tax=Ganoderma sinense ZZ0214-1 TaxID=1077348 RepID=A0A2G8SQY0_9APHY|nr:hypothetical protein GSI_01783 [Ganoderma sinense ZZ0214-1]
MDPMLASMPSTYAASVTRDLQAKVKRLNPLEDKRKSLIGISDHPGAVAPFLADRDVQKIARMPALGSAKVALDLLIAVAQGSVPDWENEGSFKEDRVPFDEAVDNLYVALATRRRRREEEGEAFEVERALEDLGSFVDNIEEFGISGCFEKSIELLESWTVRE